jgi:hypothetical protein
MIFFNRSLEVCGICSVTASLIVFSSFVRIMVPL